MDLGITEERVEHPFGVVGEAPPRVEHQSRHVRRQIVFWPQQRKMARKSTKDRICPEDVSRTVVRHEAWYVLQL